MVKTREITILLEKTYFTWKFYFKKLILKKFTWTLFILFSCFYIFVQLPIFILILIIIIMIIFVIIVFVFVIAIITSSFSKLLTFIFLVFTILFIFVYIEFFWILNKWCGWALFKVGNKDSRLYQCLWLYQWTLNTVWLTYSSDDLFLKLNIPVNVIVRLSHPRSGDSQC